MSPDVRQQPAPLTREDTSGWPQTSADDSKRSFLRVVSHELRTPLNSILGFSEILASELYGPLGADQYREYAGIIRDSGEKLLRLVNQLIELTRLQAGDVDFDLQPERLASLFEDLGEGLSDVLAARRLRLAVTPCGEAGVLVDARALRLVLANLLHNAVAFSPEGGEVRVFARQSGASLEVVVENDEAGLDAVDLARLARPFGGDEALLARPADGAGLGLAICDLTCQAMGARLRLASEPGRGFAAHLLLPTA